MKFLVTGGSGYLGTHVRRYFRADDFSRTSGVDVLNTADVVAAADYDVVIHLAAHLDKSPDAAEQVFLTNVDGTINLLKNMRRDAVFIFASTKDVYGRFADNYAEVPENCPTLYAGQSALEWSKLIAERYVEYYAHELGFRSCVFRMSTVYGRTSEGTTPNFVAGYADAINFGEQIRLPGGGRPRRDILHVDDFSAACKAFVDSVIRHGLYNIGGGHANAVTLKDLVAKLEDVSALQAVVDSENPLPDPVPKNYVTDISLITRELDWRPSITVDEGLKTLFGGSLI
ncbi:MAG TPA: NAD-dependent epimerase/dehydratase family protein [Pyrinomonadaceae bacterium]|nr:NAD-dependent epimerase/dehydratase family protein [Pyrinomonadaceae bacterium]